MQPHDEVDLEGEVNPRRPFTRFERDGPAIDRDRRALAGAVPLDGERDPDVLHRLQLRQLRAVALAECGPLAADRFDLLADDRAWRPVELARRRVSFEHEAFEDATHLGDAFLVAAENGR